MTNVNFVRGFLSILGSNVGTLAISILTTPLLVRLLGASQYGNFAFMVALYGVINMIVAPGVSSGVRKYIAEDRDDPEWDRHVFGFYVRVSVILVATVTAALWIGVVTGAITRFVPGYFTDYFYVLIAWVVLAQFFSVGKNTLRGFGLEHYSDPLLVLQNLLFALIGLSLVYVGYGVLGALLGKAVAAGIITVLAYAFVARQIPLRSVFRRPPADFPWRDLLTFNFLNILLLFLVTSLYNVDILLLQILVGSEQTGYYRAALTVAEFIWFVPFAVQTALLHSTSELWSQDEHERITELSSRVTRYVLLFGALLVIGLIALSDAFVPLYFGSDFTPAVTPLLLLLPGALGFAVARPIFAIGQGNGDLRWLIVATGVAAFVNLGLNLLLIPRYGMHGAAIATSIGYGSMLLLHVRSARAIGFDPLTDLRPLRIGGTVAISAPVVVGFARILPNDYVALVVVPPTGLVIYTWLAFKLNAVDTEEVRNVLIELPDPVVEFFERIDCRVFGRKVT